MEELMISPMRVVVLMVMSAAVSYMLFDILHLILENLRVRKAELNAKKNETESFLSELRDNAYSSMLTHASVPVNEVNHMDVKIKKLHKDAVIPSYSKAGDAGMDLTAVTKEFEVNEAGQKLLVYDTGLAVEIPTGYVGLVFPRSSISKTGLIMTNHVGVIDSGYRGTIKQKFRVDGRPTKKSSYNVGDRVAQMIILPYPSINFVESSELSSTERGDGGYGSSGK
jgi:dUTP pyrophosphatase